MLKISDPPFIMDQVKPARERGDLEILRPGRNCLSVGEAARASVLVDAAEYYLRLESALRQARRSIVIIGWDFDASIRLRQDEEESPELGALLRTLVEEQSELEVRILIWNFSTVHAPGATMPLLFGAPWQDHPRITLRLDTPLPIYGAHHQKIVCIDDTLAFVGGIDLTVQRWDTTAHAPDDRRRACADGTLYSAVHDIQMVVEGEAAADVARVAADRWRVATGEDVRIEPGPGTLWPEQLAPDFTDVPVAVARTSPTRGLRRGIREVERLNLDAIRAARRSIYIETQYFADGRIGDLLAKRLSEPDGPQVVVLVPHRGHAFLERWIMDGNRDRVLRRMIRADRFKRLRAVYPVVTSDDGECAIFIHSKLLIVDDKFLRVGSSNFNRRSTGLDTECDLAIEARDEATERGIATIRARLLAEHLGVEPDMVAEHIENAGGLIDAIDNVGGEERKLRRYTHVARRGPTRLKVGTRVLDPRGPVRVASLFTRRRPGGFFYG